MEFAKGGIIDAQTWRVITEPDGCFIPIPAEPRELATVRVQAILMEAAKAQLMGGENSDI